LSPPLVKFFLLKYLYQTGLNYSIFQTLIWTSVTVYTLTIEKVIKGNFFSNQILFKSQQGQDNISLENSYYSLSAQILGGFKNQEDGYYSLVPNGEFWYKSESISSAKSLNQLLGCILSIMLEQNLPITLNESEWPPIPAEPIQVPAGLVFSESVAIQPTATSQTEYCWLYDNFSGNFPGSNWLVTGNPRWGIDDRNDKNHCVWCGGALHPDSSDPPEYQNNMDTWMIAGPFDFTDAFTAFLDFNYCNKSQERYDYFKYCVSNNGQDYYPNEITGTQSSTVSLDLSQVPVKYPDRHVEYISMIGDSSVWIAFCFTSDSSVVDEGTFLDDIRLWGFSNCPRIDSISPASGAAGIGQVITISGQYFGNSQGNSNIFYY
jgi:hypothetical protein